jgi:putative redox protein
MIECYSRETPFEADFTNGKHTGRADAPEEKGGREAGFNPRELLEAALACCLNIWLRVYAQKQAIPLEHIMASVTLDQQNSANAVFEYTLELQGPLTEAQRQELFQAAHSCPVHQTLSGKISFNCTSA